MCGITAIIGPDTSAIRKMSELISHRGPDAEDFYFGNGFALGHRRLSILDLSPEGTQPMKDCVGNQIVFNGEIYNYLEIRDELKALHHEFRTGTDTEVILAAYREWGADCVTRFNGMWTFIIFDSKLQKLFISRDRFGVKPLYYVQSGEQTYFASEIKALLPFTNKECNLPYVTSFIITGLLDYDENTFFKGIRKVLPSHNYYLELTTGKLKKTKYYEIDHRASSSIPSPKKHLAEFTRLFEDSIRLRLRSDVKVGTCLSGGLDSSAVASIAADNFQGKEKFQGIFARTSEKELDEFHYANLVAQKKNIELNVITPEYEDFASSMDEVVYTQEEPFVSPSIFMQYFVMKKAKEVGCKVMLDGQGGDETLLGYEKYYPSVLIEKWKESGSWDFYEALRHASDNNTRLRPMHILKYFLGMFSWRLRLLGHWSQARMIKSKYLRGNFWYLKSLSESVTTSAFELQKMEIFHTNLPSLLRYEDKNSMRHSIEARLPFLDYLFVEHNLNLPSDIKINRGWSKYILRKFLSGRLPDELVWRKKKLGFVAPEKTWLRKHEVTMKRELQNSLIINRICKDPETIGLTSGSIFWRLYNVAVWERVYGVKLGEVS